MSKEKPLWFRISFWPHFVEVVRVIGYAGCAYRDLPHKLGPLYERFGQLPVNSAVLHLATCEGQMSGKPQPLTTVQLRPEVRKLAWQLLGPPPEHPFYPEYQAQNMAGQGEKPTEPEVTEEPKPGPKPKQGRKKKSRP